LTSSTSATTTPTKSTTTSNLNSSNKKKKLFRFLVQKSKAIHDSNYHQKLIIESHLKRVEEKILHLERKLDDDAN